MLEAELAAGSAAPEPMAIEGRVAALTTDILQSLEGTVGWVQVTGRKSVNGRANGWMADCPRGKIGNCVVLR